VLDRLVLITGDTVASDLDSFRVRARCPWIAKPLDMKRLIATCRTRMACA
jgi:hypothetical protein